jgi:hypothetical protein
VKLLLTSLIFASLLVLVPTIAEAKTYSNDKYTFEFPNGCKNEKKENRFSSIDANIECKGNAGIQFESSDEVSVLLALNALTQNDSGMLDTILNFEDKQWSNVYEVERGLDKYTIGNQTAPYITFTYDQEFENLLFGGTKTEDWVGMVVPIKLGPADYVIATYSNSEDSFDKQLPLAEKIIQSVEGLGNGTAVTETETDNSSTSRGDDLPKTRALCDTVTTQSAKDLCETLLN